MRFGQQIPFYDTFRQVRAENEAAGMNELAQMGAVQNVFGQLRQQQMQEEDRAREVELRNVLASTGGDVEKAMEASMKSGNLRAVQTLTPLVKLAQEQRTAKETREGLAALHGISQEPAQQPNPMMPGPYASVMAPTDAPVMSAPEPDQQKILQDRIGRLQRQQLLYANNPVVAQRFASEIERLQRDAEKAPRSRTRIDGENEVQEEYVNGKWREIGRGPRFARQVQGVQGPQTQEPLVQVEQDDGSIVWAPRSQAVGKKVGSRVKDMNLPRQVQQLGKDFEKAGLPQMIPVVDRAMQITQEEASWLTGPKAKLPDNMVPQNIQTARQSLQKLFNITLKDRSGAAVTYQELERLKKEFGAGLLNTPAQLMTAIREARNIVESHYTGIAASYGKEALDSYNTNLEAVGGLPFKVQGQAVRLTPTHPAAPQAQQGPYSDADKERRYQEWKRRNGK